MILSQISSTFVINQSTNTEIIKTVPWRMVPTTDTIFMIKINYRYMKYWFRPWNISIKIMLSDSQTKIQILGSETPLIVGRPHNVTCLVNTYGEDNITLKWNLDGETLRGTVQFEGDDDNSTTLQWILNYDFKAGDENKQLVCAAHVLYTNPHGRCSYSTSRAVDLYCE